MSRVSVEKFLSHNAENICRGTLLCCVSEKFRQRRRLWIRDGTIRILRRIFFVSVPKNTVGDPFSLSIISGIKKYWMRGWCGGMSRFSVENFLSHSAEKRLGEPFSHSSVLGIEKVWISGGGGRKGVSQVSVESFLSHNAEIFSGGTLQCCVSVFQKNSGSKKSYGYQVFPSKVFCLNLPKNFVEETSVLCFKNFPGAKKFMDKRGGGVSRFSTESFLSQLAKKFRRGNLCAVFQKISCSQIVFG